MLCVLVTSSSPPSNPKAPCRSSRSSSDAEGLRLRFPLRVGPFGEAAADAAAPDAAASEEPVVDATAPCSTT